MSDLFQGIADFRLGLASEKTAITVVPAKGQYCFGNPVVPIWLQQKLHDVFERRPDDALDVEDFFRLYVQGCAAPRGSLPKCRAANRITVPSRSRRTEQAGDMARA